MPHHKERRVQLVVEWLPSNHPWAQTVFFDGKKFNLDGQDCWMSWMDEGDKENHREMRQNGGGSVMV